MLFYGRASGGVKVRTPTATPEEDQALQEEALD
jgi:hypothetical protein